MAIISGRTPMGAVVEQNIPPEQQEARFDTGFVLLQGKSYAQAYQVFLALSKVEQPMPAALVNLGLCQLMAEEYELALHNFDRALTLLDRVQPTPKPTDGTHRKLLDLQRVRDLYRAPMSKELAHGDPGYAREVVRRLLIDTCAALGMRDRVQDLAGSLTHYPFENVRKALEQVKQ